MTEQPTPDRPLAGRPHGGGLRRYGYELGMTALVPAEAAVVREIFADFLAGASLRALAVGLNTRGVPTSGGSRWTVGGVARILDAPRYAGLLVLRGKVARTDDGGYLYGAWPPCVGLAEWEQVREMRASRAGAAASARRPDERYPLTGLVRCARCDRRMVGSAVAGYRMYACTTPSRLLPRQCTRRIGAQSLEAFVEQAAALALRTLDPAALGHPPALDGVTTGPDAVRQWRRLSPDRRAAAVHQLFEAVLIDASSTSRGVFDPGRVRTARRG
ncbi:recombinase family protein [Kitasatospora kazusensis]|uniref:recombinase family protein n=1 Tax=Kitasatospora kazusensis TaxID=407974 RepID=UPI0031D838BF